MLDIAVTLPTRTATLYEFRCRLRSERSLRSRILRRDGAPSTEPSELRFGYHALNFDIDHHEVWDGLYPLFFLTRNGGPLYNKGHDAARIRFDYPISRVVRDFYIRRAADFGIAIEVEAATTDARLDAATTGDVLAFGGGKDSRLLLGLLRELGQDPLVITAKGAYASDIADVRVTESIDGALVDRLMPSLMALPRTFWWGGTIGDVHLEVPWQQVYDMSSPGPLADWSGLFATLGADIDIKAPLTVLPYNVIQRMLHDRYPELYKGQVSTRPGARNEKSLHIALLKVHCGYSFAAQHSDEEFVSMLQRFVRDQTAHPTDFGYRNRRLTVHQEMRAIISRHRREPLFESVREQVPGDWDTAWIDVIHPYVWPELDPEMMAIYREYAPTIDETDADRSIPRIRI